MSMISEKLLRHRPQELGKIKIGGKGRLVKSRGGKEFRLPMKLDHFIVTTRNRGDDDNFVRDEAIHAKIGDAPKELHGVLMYPTPEENFHAEMVRYDGRTKVWSCDGERATNLRSGETGGCARAASGECACKPYMRLTIQLWDSPAFGFHVFRSTSWETTANIQSALRDIYERFGTCYNAPVKLVVYPASVSYTEKGQDKTSEAYMVGLVLGMSMEKVAGHMLSAQRLVATTKTELKQLAAGVQQDLAKRDEEEAADIAEEYFPPPEAAEIQEADFEIEEEPDPLEVLIRRACKIAGALDTKVNAGIEQNRDNLVEYAERVQAELANRAPDAWERAKAEIEAEAAGEGEAVTAEAGPGLFD